MQIAFNPSPFAKSLLNLPLSYVDWWLCNEIEGNELTGKEDPMEIVTDLCQRFPKSNVLLTLGKDGCLFKNAEKLIRQPAYKTNAVDTTAAGDTFTGYFLAMVSAGKDIAEALQIASKASSIAVSREGASSSIPWLEEVLSK